MRSVVFNFCLVGLVFTLLLPPASSAWNDETHIAIAKAAGYHKWFNAAAADMVKLKMGKKEDNNHYVNNSEGTIVTPEMVLAQIKLYNQKDKIGHLYGAITSSFRNYIADKNRGKFGEYHLAFCAHYVGDLSMPLHNIPFSPFNKENHKTMDGMINNEVMDNLDTIEIYPVAIRSEKEFAIEIARVANLSLKLGFQLEAEKRLITKAEAYRQISHSVSLFKAIIDYGHRLTRNSKME